MKNLENVFRLSKKKRRIISPLLVGSSLLPLFFSGFGQRLGIGLTWDNSDDASVYTNLLYRVIVQKDNGPEGVEHISEAKNWTNGVSKINVLIDPNSTYNFAVEAVLPATGPNEEDEVARSETISYATGAINLDDLTAPDIKVYSINYGPEGRIDLEGIVRDASHISSLKVGGIVESVWVGYSGRGGNWRAFGVRNLTNSNGNIIVTASDYMNNTNKLVINELDLLRDSDNDGVPDLTEVYKYKTNPLGIDDLTAPLIYINPYSTNSLDNTLQISGSLSDNYLLKKFTISGDGIAHQVVYPTNQVSGNWNAFLSLTNQGLNTFTAEAVDIFNNTNKISFTVMTDDPNTDTDRDGVSDFKETHVFSTNPLADDDKEAPQIIVNPYLDRVVPLYYEENRLELSGRIIDASPIKSFKIEGAYSDYPYYFDESQGRLLPSPKEWQMGLYLPNIGTNNIMIEVSDIFNNTNRVYLTSYLEDTRTDLDADGIPDYFEKTRTGTDFTKPDSDFDGLKDGAEISLGYNPLDADSLPFIEEMWMDERGFNLSFEANPRAMYILQRKINDAPWESIGEPIMYQSGRQSFNDSSLTGQATYRLQVESTEPLEFRF